MPDAHPPERTADERAADHAAIDRLTEELLPALAAKLGATGLGELEVHEGPWRVRLRRPAGSAPPASGSRRQHRGERPESTIDRTADRAAERSARTGHHPSDGPSARSASRSVATSPAVGIYRPRTDLAAGTRVRAGDRLGAVDMLGVPQEVVAPVDGVVGASLAESGDAVEYGQELLVVEFAPAAERGRVDVP